ncbi:EAL domain-containing protein [Limisalsivibrio acetivorans]|uniref:EAL domain-containing protein n=1 Tax=Limisalsivibrio acetivorans TaxID=1304888 RepID=UPI0003B469A6|nr:EAL domain-containing protein [Limisalsivibrio acetivorans]
MDNNDFQIDRIIENEDIITDFQPIVCLKKKRIVGLEALSRGYCRENDEIIPPFRLFSRAKETGNDTKLDRLCRKTAPEFN